MSLCCWLRFSSRTGLIFPLLISTLMKIIWGLIRFLAVVELVLETISVVFTKLNWRLYYNAAKSYLRYNYKNNLWLLKILLLKYWSSQLGIKIKQHPYFSTNSPYILTKDLLKTYGRQYSGLIEVICTRIDIYLNNDHLQFTHSHSYSI